MAMPRHSASKSLSNATRPIVQEAVTAADRRTAARLSDLLAVQGKEWIRFTVHSETGESVDLSPSLVSVLEVAAGVVASGTGVAILARDKELTSQQAADMLNVSRQYMVLERGDIASVKVGTHRRVRAQDLAAFRQRRDIGRRAALDALADQAQASGGYDAPAAPGPRRQR
jgi:excisionase family DNA binding protein